MSEQASMKIAQVKINSILGIKELEFTPEGFNEISGKNGQGKTSVLEAIKAAVGGGHDATLLRNGEEAGEIVLVLDDGTSIRKRVTSESSKVEVTQGGKKLTGAAAMVKGLTDLLQLNPIDFLRAPKKDRVRVLLETMPIEVDPQRLELISGIPVDASGDVNGLDLIEMVRKQVYDDRTGTNRAIKEKDNTINQLQLAMPEAPAGVTGSEDELQAKLKAANDAKDAELERVRTKLDGLKAETQQRIDAIKAEAQAAIDAQRTALSEIESKAGAQREKTIQKHAEAVAPINTALEAIKANRSAAAKREQAMETIEQMKVEHDELIDDVKAQTEALRAIEEYKTELLNDLPIPGLEVRGGEIYRHDIPLDRLNTAQQVDIAIEIAKLRAGKLGIICCDGIELLDSDAFEEFRRRALESGLQLFVTRVSDGEFEVKTSND